MTDKSNDYASKVPHFQFANTLAQQQQQLTDNPLIQRFQQSRQTLAADRFRPHFHFVSPESTLNDPNGLCFWQGNWHLFYQGYPPEDPRQHWGHAISPDLIHWQDLPYAIYPNPERCCYSGSAFVEKDRVIAMYFGTEVGEMIATSSDPLLLNWDKLTGNAVIPIRDPDALGPYYNIFDPFLWKKGDYYYALSAGTIPHPHNQKRTRAEFLFRSPDLIHWDYLHPFLEGDSYGLIGDDGACPYFWPLGDKHILLHFSHISGGKYLIGDYDTDRDKFLVTNGGDFNFGAASPGGVHAPSACPDANGGVIVIFNMNDAKPTPPWNQIMSLPRRLTLLDDQSLGVEPAGDIASLRGQAHHVAAMPLPANQEIVLDAVQGNCLEIEAEIDPQDAPMVELNVLRSPNKEEYTRLVFYKQRGMRNWDRYDGWEHIPYRNARDSQILLDNTYSSTAPDVTSRAPEIAPFYLPPDEPLKLHIIIDRSIVEVFVNGRQCVALRVYPDRSDSLGVSLRAQGQAARLNSFTAWHMKSIYPAT